ncbi:MAG: hypothetical protein R3A48_01015 [Polyangiales bacterium]
MRGAVRVLLVSCVVGLAQLSAGGAARADVTPPEVEACSGRSVGASCMVPGGASGTCQSGTCTRIDYAGWNRDASAAPPTMEYPCVRCVSGAAVDGGSAVASGDEGGCAVQPGGVARAAGPWLIAALPFALLFARRRKAPSAR